MQLTGLKDNAFIVTGAARGIGYAISAALAHAGARLALADRDGEALDAVAKELGDAVLYVKAADVTDKVAVEAFVENAEACVGPVSGLVNVAGIQRLDLLIDQSEEDFSATFDVNVKGVFLVTQAVARRMEERGRGAIVTISSNAARVPRMKQGSYCASKAAVSHMMRVFALELGPLGIRCNSVDPGATETDMIRNMVATMGMGELLLKGSLESFRVGTPLQKNAQVEDVANAVLFLLSEQAGHITMHDLVVDGGATLGA